MEGALLGESLLAVLHALAVPYGYTLALWSAGALAVARWGLPSRRQVVYFVLGAVCAYFVLDLPTLWLSGGPQRFSVSLPAIASLNVVPVLSVLPVALLVTRIQHKSAGYFALGFTTTLLYIVALTAVLMGGALFDN